MAKQYRDRVLELDSVIAQERELDEALGEKWYNFALSPAELEEDRRSDWLYADVETAEVADWGQTEDGEDYDENY
jgi:hypothetical protein